MISISRFFPLLTLIIAGLAYSQPEPLLGMKPLIPYLIMGIMFTMGLTLRIQDIKRVAKHPQLIVMAVATQFIVMPLTAFLLSNAFDLSPDLTVGMLVVGACAGGTASNVMAFLAKGDVALSISMTLASTLVGIFLTPLLINFYAGDNIHVDQLGIFYNLIKLVVVPVLAGALCLRFVPLLVEHLNNYLADIASSLIMFVIAIIVALNVDNLQTLSMALVAAVLLHNIIGLLAGYGVAKLAKQPEIVCRTMAFEVGMQNSGVAMALTVKYYGTVAALPAALFSIWHNISGALLAGIWARITQKKIEQIKTPSTAHTSGCSTHK